jgi:exonuclease III
MNARMLPLNSVNAYFPQSQGSIARHSYRIGWDEALREKLMLLDEQKPVILCGDFNVTRSSLDVYPENERLVWADLLTFSAAYTQNRPGAIHGGAIVSISGKRIGAGGWTISAYRTVLLNR